MRVLLSAYACEPHRGSEPGFGWNWAVSTARQGHEVWCLTSVDGREKIEAEAAKLGLANLHFVFVSVPGWVDAAYRYEPGVYLRYIVWQERACAVARELDRQVDFELVHHVTFGSLQLSTALWRLNKPLIFGPTGGGQEAPRRFRRYFYRWWRTEVFRTAVSRLLQAFNPNVKRAMRHASLVLTTNADTYRMARANGARNVRLFLDASLPEEFYPASLPPRAPGNELEILWVGRLLARKGLPLVLEALGRVRPDVRFRLTILGDGPMNALVPQWIEQYGLEGRVDWKGQVPWEAVKEAYRQSDVFMFCSLRDSFASQFLEAMAYGLPVITLDLHGAGAMIPDDAAIKVPVTTPEQTAAALAAAVERLHDDPALRAEMGRQGYAFSRTQTWALKTRQVAAFYRELGIVLKSSSTSN